MNCFSLCLICILKQQTNKYIASSPNLPFFLNAFLKCLGVHAMLSHLYGVQCNISTHMHRTDYANKAVSFFYFLIFLGGLGAYHGLSSVLHMECHALLGSVVTRGTSACRF